jgi:hypothetical protein
MQAHREVVGHVGATTGTATGPDLGRVCGYGERRTVGIAQVRHGLSHRARRLRAVAGGLGHQRRNQLARAVAETVGQPWNRRGAVRLEHRERRRSAEQRRPGGELVRMQPSA